MVSSPLRILALVTDAFGGHGGIAQYNRDFLTSLAQSDRIGDIIVLPRATARWPVPLPAGVQQLRPVNDRLAYSLEALQTARACRPIDVVFCGHLFMAPLAAAITKFLRANLWVQVHGIDAWEELSVFHRRSVETAALITSVSRYTRRRLLGWTDMDPARVKVLPDTIDARFKPGPKPSYLLDRYTLHGRKVVMTVSRLADSERYKGHDRVIRALPQVLLKHPETIYVIVGDGDDRPRLEALAAETGVTGKVLFVGQARPEELPDHFRLADVFAMPSTGEGFGIAFLEAMATGIRVIGGNLDGSLDPLADGVLGRAIDPDNADELASAICSALCAGPARADLDGRFNFQNFTKHLDALVKLAFIARH